MNPYPYSPPPVTPPSDKRVVAGVLGILLGGFGVHKFVLGYTNEGIIMLAVALCSFGFAYPIMHLIGLIEGIIYLTKSDAEFDATYIHNRRGWF